jgi:aminoglycoside phosphotransferase family enzyme/predicted kinase
MAHLIDDPVCDEVCAWLAVDADRLIETHCAWVVLKGDVALKLKRPVDLGYLDFSTRDKRRWALERELEFNRATAPTIYRALRTITRKPYGGLEMDGPGEVLEWALEMRRFDDGSVLSLQPDRVQGDLAERLGRVVAGLHKAADVKPQGGGTTALGYTITSNAEHLRHLAEVLGAEAVEVLVAATDRAFAEQSPLLNARQALGLGRRCHGDLHLGNIFIENDEPVAFDCIEFNDQLSDIDIQYDIAFLLMDLLFRGNRAGAVRVLSGYLDEAARSFGPTVFEGLAALPLMLSVRAAVRAHVSAQMGQADLAQAYVQAGIAFLSPRPAQLVAVGGLSGSGKSYASRLIAPDLQAVILRSDEVRKRLWGIGPLQTLPKAAYGPGQSERVYGTMLAEAALILRAGQSVVLDAVFLRLEERQAAEALATELGLGFQGYWMEASEAVLRERIQARVGDASDADGAVLTEQLTRDPGPLTWTRARSDQTFMPTVSGE